MQIINTESLRTDKKVLDINWFGLGGNIISVLIIVAISTVFWLGASAIFSKDKLSIERYETQLKSLVTTQTSKIFNEISNDPKSVAAAKSDFRELAKQIDNLKAPKLLSTIHQEYVQLYNSFSEDPYWLYQKNHAADHTKIDSALAGRDVLWKKHDEDWAKAKKRLIHFNEQLEGLNLKLIDLIE